MGVSACRRVAQRHAQGGLPGGAFLQCPLTQRAYHRRTGLLLHEHGRLLAVQMCATVRAEQNQKTHSDGLGGAYRAHQTPNSAVRVATDVRLALVDCFAGHCVRFARLRQSALHLVFSQCPAYHLPLRALPPYRMTCLLGVRPPSDSRGLVAGSCATAQPGACGRHPRQPDTRPCPQLAFSLHAPHPSLPTPTPSPLPIRPPALLGPGPLAGSSPACPSLCGIGAAPIQLLALSPTLLAVRHSAVGDGGGGGGTSGGLFACSQSRSYTSLPSLPPCPSPSLPTGPPARVPCHKPVGTRTARSRRGSHYCARLPRALRAPRAAGHPARCNNAHSRSPLSLAWVYSLVSPLLRRVALTREAGTGVNLRGVLGNVHGTTELGLGVAHACSQGWGWWGGASEDRQRRRARNVRQPQKRACRGAFQACEVTRARASKRGHSLCSCCEGKSVGRRNREQRLRALVASAQWLRGFPRPIFAPISSPLLATLSPCGPCAARLLCRHVPSPFNLAIASPAHPRLCLYHPRTGPLRLRHLLVAPCHGRRDLPLPAAAGAAARPPPHRGAPSRRTRRSSPAAHAAAALPATLPCDLSRGPRRADPSGARVGLSRAHPPAACRLFLRRELQCRRRRSRCSHDRRGEFRMWRTRHISEARGPRSALRV